MATPMLAASELYLRAAPVNFLEADDVHVWRIALTQPPKKVRELLYTLSADERERAARFHFPHDRDSFIVARGALRDILASYLAVEPCELRFQYSSYGKPSLSTEFAAHGLNFNLSHSHELALLGLAIGREIGVDVERHRSDVTDEPLAERFFSAREVAVLRALPRRQQTEAFFNCWTRKEAYIKARGEGLSFPLARFDVSLAPEEPAKLLRTRGEPREAARWTMRNLSPAPGYAGAVIAEGRNWRLQCRDWSAL
jgi:4'-phosphopantetheinyl transferase